MKRIVLGVALAASTGSVFAAGVSLPAQTLIQPYFRSLDAGSALNNRYSGGLSGGLLGGAVSGGIGLISDKGTVSRPAALYSRHRLPWGLDFGTYYDSVANSHANLTGVDMSYRVLNEGLLSPGVAVRGSYTRLNGADRLDLDSRGLELSLSKGFGFATPYAGLGRLWVNSNPAVATGLSDERLSLNKYFVGANFRIGLTDLALEADKTGQETTLGAKIGVKF